MIAHPKTLQMVTMAVLRALDDTWQAGSLAEQVAILQHHTHDAETYGRHMKHRYTDRQPYMEYVERRE